MKPLSNELFAFTALTVHVFFAQSVIEQIKIENTLTLESMGLICYEAYALIGKSHKQAIESLDEPKCGYAVLAKDKNKDLQPNLDALEQAGQEGRPFKAISHVYHSDHGSQYLSILYSERLTEAGIEPSVGRGG